VVSGMDKLFSNVSVTDLKLTDSRVYKSVVVCGDENVLDDKNLTQSFAFLKLKRMKLEISQNHPMIIRLKPTETTNGHSF
jgi:hypothetical protein